MVADAWPVPGIAQPAMPFPNATQRKRKLIRQGFRWARTVGRIRQVMMCGLAGVGQFFVLDMAAEPVRFSEPGCGGSEASDRQA
jgi:hypothetical protein